MAIVGVTQAREAEPAVQAERTALAKTLWQEGKDAHKILRGEYGWDAERTEEVRKWAGARPSRATSLC